MIVGAVLAAAIMAGAGAQQAPKLYRWVDKHGVVHYGSSVPPQYANQQLEVLNSEGITVDKIAGQRTPQEIASEQRAKATALHKAKQAQRERLKDQMLLDTYASTSDIKHDRDSRIAAINSQINVTNNAISGLQGSLAEYQERVTGLIHAGKPVPSYLKTDLSKTRQELLTDRQLLINQRQEKQATEKRYTAYIKRFRQLTETPSGDN